MDDDKQVKDLTTQTTIRRFLSKPVLPDEKDKETFDLEKEFAKSAKNRSPVVPLAVAAFLILLAIGSWVASQFTEQASAESSVSIGSFEDLKLKEIFDTARKNKKDLEAVQAQIAQLTEESDSRVAALKQAGASKADIASVNDASGAQAKAIQDQTAKQVAAEKAALAAALQPLKAQADEVQKKIDSYDDRIGQMNKKNQQVLDTQQRLFDLEKKKITDQYEARIQAQTEEATATLTRVKQERDALVAALKAKQADDIRKLILKYNPVIGEGAVFTQLGLLGTKVAAYPGLVLPDRIVSSGALSAELQTNLAARVEKAHLLLARLREIPYQNSVPPLLNALDNAIADSLAGYDGYLAPLAAAMTSLDGIIAERDATIVQKNDQIAQLEATVAGLQAELAAALADRKAAEAAEAEDRAGERARAAALLARWTGAVDDFVGTLREDGLFVDMRDGQDWMVVLKADRAKSLASAIATAAATPPPTPVPGKTAPVIPPVNLATVRDGLGGSELGTVLVEQNASGGWTAKLVKQSDPKKPFKAFDRIVLSLPVPKK